MSRLLSPVLHCKHAKAKQQENVCAMGKKWAENVWVVYFVWEKPSVSLRCDSVPTEFIGRRKTCLLESRTGYAKLTVSFQDGDHKCLDEGLAQQSKEAMRFFPLGYCFALHMTTNDGP